MITKRDLEIFKFINKYGKSYLPVMEKTFFPSVHSAKKRITDLHQSGLVSYWNTKLQVPRKAIVLTQETKEYLYETFDIKPKNPTMNMSTIHHNIVEQITDYHLSKIGTIERTTVATHTEQLHHIPDFIFTSKNGQKFNVEIELTKKTSKRYQDIFFKTAKDNIHGILYIFPKKTDIQRYAEFFPRDKRLLLIDIETLIQNITNFQKINPYTQEQILLEIASKNIAN